MACSCKTLVRLISVFLSLFYCSVALGNESSQTLKLPSGSHIFKISYINAKYEKPALNIYTSDGKIIKSVPLQERENRLEEYYAFGPINSISTLFVILSDTFFYIYDIKASVLYDFHPLFDGVGSDSQSGGIYMLDFLRDNLIVCALYDNGCFNVFDLTDLSLGKEITPFFVDPAPSQTPNILYLFSEPNKPDAAFGMIADIAVSAKKHIKKVFFDRRIYQEQYIKVNTLYTFFAETDAHDTIYLIADLLNETFIEISSNEKDFNKFIIFGNNKHDYEKLFKLLKNTKQN